VEILVSIVVEQRQVLKAVVGLVAVEMMDVQPLRNRAVLSFPDDTVLQVATSVGLADANVALPQRPLTAAPVVMVLSRGMAESGAAVGAERRVDPVPFSGLIAAGWQAAIAARLPRLRWRGHIEMVGH